MMMDDSRAVEVERLVRDFLSEAEKAESESETTYSMARYHGAMIAFVNMLYREVKEESHLITHIPEALAESIEEIKSNAVMDKLKADL